MGTFNLVRREIYEAIGTHERLRLELVDNVKLGKLVKMHGFRQDALDSQGLVSVRWQQGGLREYVRGLDKNGFAAFDFKVGRVIQTSALIVLAHIFPFLGVLWLDGFAQWAYVLSVLLCTLGHMALGQLAGLSGFYALIHPIGSAVLLWSIWRSSCLALRKGVVKWRGTAYPLRSLRQHMV